VSRVISKVHFSLVHFIAKLCCRYPVPCSVM
jgi:hypothetical protein